MKNSWPERASSTVKPPFLALAAPCLGVKYSMNLRARPILGGLEGIEHRRRSAAIEVGILRCCGDDAGDIEEAPFVLIVEMEARAGDLL